MSSSRKRRIIRQDKVSTKGPFLAGGKDS